MLIFFSSCIGCWVISYFVIPCLLKVSKCICDPCCHLAAETGSWFILRLLIKCTMIWLHHRHLRYIDCLSFVMCLLLAPVLIVNRLLFSFFFFCCGHLQNYWSKQGRRYVLLSSQYFLDVYGLHLCKSSLASTDVCSSTF